MFTENRFDLGYDQGTTGGPQFSTTVIVTGGGHEQRNANWAEARSRWQIGDRIYNRAELEYTTRFFSACRGSLIGFRYRDWGDYQVNNEVIATGDGVTTQFQIAKTYGLPGLETRRNIRKPVNGSVVMTVNDFIEPDVTVDYTTGIVTFATPPFGVIRATCDFDVPVRFEQDRFERRYEGGTSEDAMFYVSSLSLLEIRV